MHECFTGPAAGTVCRWHEVPNLLPNAAHTGWSMAELLHLDDGITCNCMGMLACEAQEHHVLLRTPLLLCLQMGRRGGVWGMWKRCVRTGRRMNRPFLGP